MKKILKQFVFFVVLSTLLIGCSNRDGFSLDNYRIDIATIENPQKNPEFFMRLDNNSLLWTAASNFSNYRPKDGQRVIANYSVLFDKRATGKYDYDVKLNDVYEVLTKGIFEITPEKQDSIGNDSVYVSKMWIGNKFLNVEFYYYGQNKIHYINLVSDTAKTYPGDGKVHLEFRHNANNDASIIKRVGVVSFDISSLQTDTSDSVALVIHVNKPNQVEEQLFNLTYRYNKPGGAGKIGQAHVEMSKGYIREDEVR